MTIEIIKNALQQKIGLYAQSIGDSSVHRAVEIRLRKHKLDSIEKYTEMLDNSHVEFDALVEEIVVPETWFFRYRKSFSCISDHITALNKSLTEPSNIRRILSFPCSTGEEPYSILIQLSEENVPLSNVKIDAIDISKRSLAKGQQGFYASSAIKDMDSVLLKKYFSEIDNGFQINKRFRDHINFKRGNFLIGSISPKPCYYDVILCRNLLIYFDAELKKIAMEKLHRALKPDGLLVLGHAESSTINSKYFSRFGDKRNYTFHRVNRSVKPSEKIQNNFRVEKTDQSSWKTSFGRIITENHSKDKAGDFSKQYARVEDVSLRLIENLVTNGQFSEAESLIDKRLQKNSEDSSAYYFFALIKLNEGDVKLSESILKKVIYLDPDHEKALEQLKAIAQDNADLESVSKYDRRLSRIRTNKKPSR